MKKLISLAVLLATLSAPMHAQEIALSLEQALNTARENNKEWKSVQVQSQMTREDVRMARSAMMPNVTASGAYTYYFDRQVIFMPGSFAGNPEIPVTDVAVGGKNAFHTALTLHQPLLSETARRQIRAAHLQESIQTTSERTAKAALTIEVTETYYSALVLLEQINLTRQSLERNKKSLNDSRTLLLQGKSLKVDTLRNFIIVENLKTSIAHLETQHKIVLRRLNQLLGLPAESHVTLTDSLVNNIQSGLSPGLTLPEKNAVNNRADIQAKELQVELSKTKLSYLKAQRIPTVSLVGAVQLQAQADDRRFDSYRWPRTSFVGISAQLPIFQGNRVNASVRQSAFVVQKSILELDDAKDKAETEIHYLHNELQEVSRRIEVQERTIEAAEMNYQIIQDRYAGGISSRLELSDAELALTESKLNYINLLFELNIKRLRLDHALGLL